MYPKGSFSELFMKMLKDKLFDDQGFTMILKGVPLHTGPIYDDFVPLEATVCFIRLGKKVMWQKNVLFPGC